MMEKRYSFRTVAKYIGLTVHAVHMRAKKLGIDTSHGITAEQVKIIMEAPGKKRGTLKELEAELEVSK